MLRREKIEVLKDLPPKIRTVLEMQLTEPIMKSYLKAETEFLNWLAENEGQEAVDRARMSEALVRIGKLRRLAVQGRMKAMKEWIDDFLLNEKKLVIFGWHKDVLKELAETYKAPLIIGETKLDDRQQYIDRFQEDPKEKILILGISAGGVGITLTSASDVLFIETAWTSSECDQAEDRCHRYGQKDSVNCYYAVARGTIDESMLDLVEEKRNIFKRTMGEKNNIKKSVSKIGMILNRLKGEHDVEEN
jgi:SWI/SNF-related matrix-associated actin-dependent regulator 1 of chromatin subfamily A